MSLGGCGLLLSLSKEDSSKDTWNFFFQHVTLGGELLPYLLVKTLVLSYGLNSMLVEKNCDHNPLKGLYVIIIVKSSGNNHSHNSCNNQ